MSELFSCKICSQNFDNRSTLDQHRKSNHQSMTKIKFGNSNVVTEVKRGSNDKFKCNCGKSFKLPRSFRDHAKKCSDEIVEEVIMKSISSSESDEDDD